MNVNTNTPMGGPYPFLADDIADHQEIMQRSGEDVLTGAVALISEGGDLEGTGSLQVWSQTSEGDWIYVTPDGVVVRTDNPIGE